MSNRRWSKFWWQDWMRDPALRSCSLAARGLWMDMLAIAHDGTPYGHVTINGKAATARQVGSICGCGEKEAGRLIAELEEAGVFSRTDDGMIYSRRMVRDKAASDTGRENGLTGGNPSLKADTASKVNGGGNDGGLTPPLTSKSTEAEAEERTPLSPPLAPDKPRSARGTRLPADWQASDQDRQFAAGFGLVPEQVAERFCDYWHAKAGQNGVKLDWSATWRNWCRREAEQRGSAPKAIEAQPIQPVDMLAKAREMRAAGKAPSLIRMFLANDFAALQAFNAEIDGAPSVH